MTAERTGPDPATGRATPVQGTTRRRLLGVAAGAAIAATSAGAGTSWAGTRAARDRSLCSRDGSRDDLSGLRVLWRARTDEPVLALTFDDGPDPRYTPGLLDALAAQEVRATFFLVGQHAYERRELVRRQLADRHELGNHSWSHRDLSLLDLPEVRSELSRTTSLLADLAGRPPTVVRPPYGRLTGAVLQAAGEAGLDVVAWAERIRDGGLAGHLDVAGNIRRVVDALRPGMVLLAHDGGPRPREVGMAAVPDILRAARERGFRFVTASEMLELDGGGAQRPV